MLRHFPYYAAAAVTSTVGAVASLVCAAPASSAPAHVAPPGAGVVQVTPAPIAAGNMINTPASTPVTPGLAQVAPVQASQQAGMGGVPGTPSFSEGFRTVSPPGSTLMNQPGQPPFNEGFSGNQGLGSRMGVAGRADFYNGFGFNQGVVPSNQGVSPATPYPTNPSATPTSTATPTVVVAPSVTAQQAATTTQSVGFFNGFGGGQPNMGFYSGFTTPR
jgi:hypothetical protein